MATLAALQDELRDIQALLGHAQTPRAQKLLREELERITVDLGREAERERKEQEEKACAAACVSAAGASSSSSGGGASSPSAQDSRSGRKVVLAIDLPRYGWDQSPQFAKVYVTVPECTELDAKHCELLCTEKAMTLLVHAPNGREYRLCISPLAGAIVPSGCSVKAKPAGSVTISLKKSEATTWSSLVEKKDDKKYDSLEKEKDPDKGLMQMMQKLYEDGDEEMKRTMAKAWYESRSGKTPEL
eukprot:RCo030567